GFIPGRALADSITIFQAALRQQVDEPTLSLDESPGILSADIKKAYGSVERPSILALLRAMGFPQPYVDLVDTLMAGSVLRFEVNGKLLAWVDQATGIRQGCPFAPLLFIITMEPLLTTLQAHASQHALVLGARLDRRVACNVHVDDTTVFVQRMDSNPWVREQFAGFADMTGLTIQLDKSFGICLNKANVNASYHGLPLLQPNERRRYLGLLVGLGDLAADNWERAYESTVARLRVAAMKSKCEPSKARLLQTIVQPKAAFVASLVWHFFWRGNLAVGTGGRLPQYIPKAILQASRAQQGWGIPNIDALCSQQAVRRVMRLVLTTGLLDKACHVPARPLRAVTADTVLDCGYRLLCNALGRADRPNAADLAAKLDFFRWARKAITLVWHDATTCRVHVPEPGTRWVAHLATVRRMDPGRRHFLWYQPLENNAWLPDSTGRAERAHLHWLYVLALAHGAKANTALQHAQNRIYLPSAWVKRSVRRRVPLERVVSRHAVLELTRVPPSLDRYSPHSGAVRWLHYRWHLEAFPFQTAADAPTCPHCGALDGSAHTFVQCPRAQSAWQTLLGLWFGRDAQCITVADHVRSIVTHEQLAAPTWLLQAPPWRSHVTVFDRLPDPTHIRYVTLGYCEAQYQFHTRRHHGLRACVFASLVQQHGKSAVLEKVHHETSLTAVAYFDGAARQDPQWDGSGSLVYLLETPNRVMYQANYLATATTNNKAEYDGLITALHMLLMQQMKGIFRVQEARLQKLHMRARELAARFTCTWEHRPREFNQATDHLSKLAPDACISYAYTDGGRLALLPADERLQVEELLAADV
ncbi:hypothetical protein ACHHYP_11279, partial [Achlya hypogyna]